MRERRERAGTDVPPNRVRGWSGILRRVPHRRALALAVVGVATIAGAVSSVAVARLRAKPPRPVSHPELSQAAPSPRSESAMAYDPATATTLLFGGNSSGQALQDTWSWNGSHWSELHPATIPPPLAAPVMAYDPLGGQLVLVGSDGGGSPESTLRTLTWNGSDWRDQPAAVLDSGARAVLAEDQATDQLILVTGDALGTTTWQWTGRSWLALHPATSPDAPGLLAFDSQTERLLMVSGTPGSGARGAVTRVWSWNGTDWTPEHSPSGPQSPPGEEPEVLTASADGPLLLTSLDMYLWRGGTWNDLGLTPDPHRIAEAAAYDAARQQVVLFGGSCLTCMGLPLVNLDDTWTWKGTWTPHIGTSSSSPAQGAVGSD